MKKIVTYTLCVMIFLSCKKEEKTEPIVVSPAKPTLQKGQLPTVKIQPGANQRIGMYTLTVGDMPNFELGVDVSFVTQNFSQFRNFYFTIKKQGDSTGGFTSFKKVTVGEHYGYPDWIQLLHNSVYTIVLYADVLQGATGNMTTKLDLEYEWGVPFGGGGFIPHVVGQTIEVSLYHSMPSFTFVPLQGVMKDSVQTTYLSFTVTNIGTKRISIAQCTIALNVIDVNNDDTIVIFNPKWIINNTDESSRVKFLNSVGTPVTHYGEGLQKMIIPYVTGNRELSIEPGEMYDIDLAFSVGGLRHDGNGMSLELLTSDVTSIPFGYINLASPGQQLKITTTQSANSSGAVHNLTWSQNESSHSAIPGGSSKTFINGYGFPSLPVQHWHQ